MTSDDCGIKYGVTLANGDSAVVESLWAEFGDGHRVEISQNGRKTSVRLVGKNTDMVLDASGGHCQFERGINLLRLYMAKS
jgi:hypothetical protein